MAPMTNRVQNARNLIAYKSRSQRANLSLTQSCKSFSRRSASSGSTGYMKRTPTAAPVMWQHLQTRAPWLWCQVRSPSAPTMTPAPPRVFGLSLERLYITPARDPGANRGPRASLSRSASSRASLARLAASASRRATSSTAWEASLPHPPVAPPPCQTTRSWPHALQPHELSFGTSGLSNCIWPMKNQALSVQRVEEMAQTSD